MSDKLENMIKPIQESSIDLVRRGEYGFPKNKQDLLKNLENWDELNTGLQALTMGQAHKMYGVVADEEGRKLIIADIKGEISSKMSKELQYLVHNLHIDIEEGTDIIRVYHEGQIMAISDNVLARINDIVEVKKQDARNAQRKARAMQAIENNFLEGFCDQGTIDTTIDNILHWHEISGYHKINAWAACTSMFLNQDINLEDREQRSAVLNRLKNL